ncbi:MAG: L-seryl-tRNA(Sec) selenium transferase [Actinomycetales bacterium]|nr:L-seryl-tRNA(Sec) selenium transferase [Actinomycetales bacterium]
MPDARSQVPRTDRILTHPAVAALLEDTHRDVVRQWVRDAQELVRTGRLAPDDVVPWVLGQAAPPLPRVINATGVIVHTNLGRAPLGTAAREALTQAARTTPVELDLGTGRRGPRAPEVVRSLLARVPAAEAAHVTGNGAAAVLLAVTAVAAGREVIVSRGELVEIGDGFRLPALLETTGARLREVGTTNRTTTADYASAITPETAAILKVHPSNFTVSGFTSSADIRDLSALGVPVIADIGSGLLAPHALLPDEPDATTTLTHGAAVVTCSGDKLLGGPQAGLLLGRADLVQRARRHPLARALRPGKLTLAALAATLRAASTPVEQMLTADPTDLRERAESIVGSLPAGASVRPTTSVVGGGGAPGVTMASTAVALPEHVAQLLRDGEPPVLARVTEGRCVVDLRTVAPSEDATLLTALRSAMAKA